METNTTTPGPYYVVADNDHPTLWVRAEGDKVQGYDYRGSGALGSQRTDVEAVLRDHCGDRRRWGRATYRPGQFHPRISREGSPAAHLNPLMVEQYRHECESALQAARILFSRLDQAFLYIEPHEANLETHGHELRHLLILACTEVESGLKAVLAANQAPRSRAQRLTIRDYYVLCAAMRLSEWKIELVRYPRMQQFVPFQGWTEEAPPAWWTAHNHVKHNREDALHDATLRQVLGAMSALYVVIAAQFGVVCLHLDGRMPLPPLCFRAADGGFPRWDTHEFYVPPKVPGGHDEWTAVPLFDGSGEG